MVRNYHNLKLSYLVTILIIVFGIFPNICCHRKSIEETGIPLKESALLSSWDDLFEKSVIVPLTFDDDSLELYSINSLELNSKGEYFILDPKNKRKILYFDSSGKFVKYIGKVGEGPSEYLLPTCIFLDEKDNFYVYDLSRRVINKYSAYEYSFASQLRFQESFQDVIFDLKGNFITYTLNSEKNRVLFKNDPEGKLMDTAYKPRDKNLRIFFSRFGLGRISKMKEKGFLFFFPGEYKIHLFDYDFRVLKVLYAEKPSKYQPSFEPLPKQLNPFTFSKEHSKWLSKQLRPALIYYLGKRLFLIVLVKYRNLSGEYYINIHDLDGNTYAYGIKVPFNGLIRYVKDGSVYIVENSKFDEKGNLMPLRLHCFKLKDIKGDAI